MKYLYKYTPHNTEYKYDIITKSQLWFSKIESFNDPIDSQLDYRQEYAQDEIKRYWENFPTTKLGYTLEKTLIKYGNSQAFVDQQNRIFSQQRSDMGVLCFSVNQKNILMWSHYANHHKGIVYEFKPNLFSNSLCDFFTGNPYRVDYPVDRNYDLLSYTLSGKEMEDQFVKELLTKAKDWDYEEEYRMIDLENSGSKNFNKLALSSIIFGVKTSDDEIYVMRCLCDKHGFHHVKFKKVEFVKGKFELIVIDI